MQQLGSQALTGNLGERMTKIILSRNKTPTKTLWPLSQKSKQDQLNYLDQLSFSILLEKNLMNMRKQLKKHLAQ